MGTALLAAGSVASAISTQTANLPLFVVAAIVAGFGFGGAFMGALRMIVSRLAVMFQ
ncbi:MAG: hypothetical protein V4573_08820 [Pseudomonadota bacterium]